VIFELRAPRKLSGSHVTALIQWWHDATDADIHRVFPEGRPVCPLVHAKADNTSGLAWLNRATTSSAQGQLLIPVYSALLRLEEVGITGDHVAGSLNDQTDMISRRSDPSLPPAVLAAQLL
jgi:hypothetical protein